MPLESNPFAVSSSLVIIGGQGWAVGCSKQKSESFVW